MGGCAADGEWRLWAGNITQEPACFVDEYPPEHSPSCR